jgi:hypothetical protein
LFLAKAKVAGDEEEEVLIKLVQGNYGEDAHCIAAENGLAPKLYGQASFDGAPTAYVMEYLSKGQGWQHPQRHLIRLPTSGHFNKLEAEIHRFLRLLEEYNLVHGDLRSINMFIHVQGDNVELRVVDWDWAGIQGDAQYPVDVNPAADLGFPYQPIYTVDDQRTIIKCFDQLKEKHGLYQGSIARIHPHRFN